MKDLDYKGYLEGMCDYFDIKDRKTFVNAPIKWKKSIIQPSYHTPAETEDGQDLIIASFGKTHELRHAAHRRIIEDLLKEDPKVIEFYRQDIKKTKDKPYFVYKIYSGLQKISKKLLNKKTDNEKLKELESLVDSAKTEEVTKNSAKISGYMLNRYAQKNYSLVECFANGKSRNMGVATYGGLSVLTTYLTADCVRKGAEDLVTYLSTKAPDYVPGLITAVPVIALIALISRDCIRMTVDSYRAGLTKQKLDKFTPRERKYLVSLPSTEKPEKRLKEMKKFGLKVGA